MNDNGNNLNEEHIMGNHNKPGTNTENKSTNDGTYGPATRAAQKVDMGAPKVDRNLKDNALESNYVDLTIMKDSTRADNTKFKVDKYLKTHAKGNQPPAGSGMPKTCLSIAPAKGRTKMKQKQGQAENKATRGVENSNESSSSIKGNGAPPPRPLGPKPQI